MHRCIQNVIDAVGAARYLCWQHVYYAVDFIEMKLFSLLDTEYNDFVKIEFFGILYINRIDHFYMTENVLIK